MEVLTLVWKRTLNEGGCCGGDAPGDDDLQNSPDGCNGGLPLSAHPDDSGGVCDRRHNHNLIFSSMVAVVEIQDPESGDLGMACQIDVDGGDALS